IDEMRSWLEVFLIYMRDVLVCEVSRSQDNQILSVDKKGIDIKKTLDLYNEILSLYQKSDMNLNKKIVWNYVKEVIKDKV
ncbi:MAG: hypothetical protein SNJ53_04815, partial [Thermodesulfovibrionales bacterium]